MVITTHLFVACNCVDLLEWNFSGRQSHVTEMTNARFSHNYILMHCELALHGVVYSDVRLLGLLFCCGEKETDP